jgi:hypothetical protein
MNLRLLALGLTLALVLFTFILPQRAERKVRAGRLQTRRAAAPQVLNPNELLIDDFESSTSPAPWMFSSGDSPGATGTLAAGDGHHGKGARLAYDFTGGGTNVSADLELSTLLSGEAIAFWARAPDGCWLSLRVRDATGQVLEYALSRPLEASDPTAWYRQVVELDAPTSFDGGANDGVLHDGIAGLSIVAANFANYGLEQGLASAIDFDEVTLIRNLQFDLNPFDASLTPAPAGAANLMDNLGVNIHFPVSPQYAIDTRALDAARDAGFSWVRMDLFWSDIETKRGVYNFSNFDKLLAALEARGMKPLFVLDFSNLLHSDCARCADWFTYGPQSSSTVKAFGDYAEAAAKHFAGHGVRYEVWNEPNQPVFWGPGPNANQYGALAKEVIARVHSGDTNASITATGGLAGFDFQFLRGVLSSGGAQGADAIAVHPYRSNGPESATDEMAHLKSIVAGAFPSMMPALWETEWGYSSSWFGGNPAAWTAQASLVVREMLAAKAMGFPFTIYYDIRDDGTDPANSEHNFGLLANDYSDKPAISALRTLKAFATNRVFSGSLPAQPTSLHALRLDGATDTVIVIWMDQPGAKLSITLPSAAIAFDMLGSLIATESNSNERGVVQVSESAGPIYVTIPETRNAIDNTRFFVTQHYRDFLNREPDPDGFDYWTAQIDACGADQQCLEQKRADVSAAYFLSTEFQNTGYLVERMYKVAYGEAEAISTNGSVHTVEAPMIQFKDFLPDTQQIGRGVIVGQGGWEQRLESNKQDFASQFVQRSRFTTALPTTMTPAQFVDKLNQNAGNVLSSTDSVTVISFFNGATDTSNLNARAQALRQVAENQNLLNSEFNRAFVLMQYFGYLRRNPNDLPDADYTGYDFWLTKLNQFNGNYSAAEMVKAFIVSTEYRQRFGP